MNLNIVKINDELEDALLDMQAREKWFNSFIKKEFLGGKFHSTLRLKMQQGIEDFLDLLEYKQDLSQYYQAFFKEKEEELNKLREEAITKECEIRGFDRSGMVFDPNAEGYDRERVVEFMDITKSIEIDNTNQEYPEEIADFILAVAPIATEINHELQDLIKDFNSKNTLSEAGKSLSNMNKKDRREYIKYQRATERSFYERLQKSFLNGRS